MQSTQAREMIKPRFMTPIELIIKRTLDVIISFIVVFAFSPVWLILMLFVWADTKASPIYSQTRVGKNGKYFTIYKFRSMRADAEADGPKLAQKNDLRITPLGKYLRKYRVDELPQFWNVLIGDMSIVGPRPERPNFTEQLAERSECYSQLHLVRPGITSWGQVKYGYAENIDQMLERMVYDLHYIENMSLKMDTRVVISTVGVVLGGRGQ